LCLVTQTGTTRPCHVRALMTTEPTAIVALQYPLMPSDRINQNHNQWPCAIHITPLRAAQPGFSTSNGKGQFRATRNEYDRVRTVKAPRRMRVQRPRSVGGHLACLERLPSLVLETLKSPSEWRKSMGAADRAFNFNIARLIARIRRATRHNVSSCFEPSRPDLSL
jgi:hypothetical protein